MWTFCDRARRRLLQLGAVGLGGVSLPAILRAEQQRSGLRGARTTAPGTAGAQGSQADPQPATRKPSCRSVVLIYLDGGASHIDLLDLKPSAPAEIRGPYQPIASRIPGVTVGELLPEVAQVLHYCALIRSAKHQEMVHDPAVYQMLTGYKHLSSAGGLKVEETDLPHMASSFLAADRGPASMPKVLQLPETMKMEARVLPGQNGGILGPTCDPFRVDVTPEAEVLPPEFALQADLTPTRVARRWSLLAQLQSGRQRVEQTQLVSRFDLYQQQAWDILNRPSIDKAFDLSLEPDALRDRYGRHRHGQSVLLARRLVEAGARFVTVYWGREPQDWADGKGPRPANNPWDTHRNHFPLLQTSLVPRADQTLAAFLSDLHDRGLLAETLVVWMGDFGRTPRISKPWNSRDHWPHAFSLLMAGGGISGGVVHGVTDRHAAYVTADPVSPADITATIYDRLGLDPATIVEDRHHRPHRISTGTPISNIFI